MVRVEFDMETTLPPERLVEALTDFTDRRPQLWPDLNPDIYEVYEVGETTADVREGSRSPKIWAREHYDWSTPGLVTWTVRKSNFCAPGSSVSARVTPKNDGGSRVHIRWERIPLGMRSRVMLGLVGLSGGRPVKARVREAFDNLERRMGR